MNLFEINKFKNADFFSNLKRSLDYIIFVRNDEKNVLKLEKIYKSLHTRVRLLKLAKSRKICFTA